MRPSCAEEEAEIAAEEAAWEAEQQAMAAAEAEEESMSENIEVLKKLTKRVQLKQERCWVIRGTRRIDGRICQRGQRLYGQHHAERKAAKQTRQSQGVNYHTARVAQPRRRA